MFSLQTGVGFSESIKLIMVSMNSVDILSICLNVKSCAILPPIEVDITFHTRLNFGAVDLF